MGIVAIACWVPSRLAHTIKRQKGEQVKIIAIILSALLLGGFYCAEAGEPLDKYKNDSTHTGTLNVRIESTSKSGVWEYTIVNQDDPGYGIITFELHDLAENTKIVGSPRGWKTMEEVMRSAPGALPPSFPASAKPVIAWVANEGYEIQAGQSLSGFQISASTNESANVEVTVTSMFVDKDGIHPGRVAFKSTQGPGVIKP